MLSFFEKYPKIILIFNFLRMKKLTVFFALIYSAYYGLETYHLEAEFSKLSSRKGSIVARKLMQMDQVSSGGLIEILTAFAKVNNDQLWIHKMNVKGNNLDLKIRAFDNKTIEKYMHKVAKIANLKIKNMTTKNVKFKKNKDEDEEKKAPVPFAVQLFMKNAEFANGSKDEDEDKEDDGLAKILFTYETQVKLFAPGR